MASAQSQEEKIKSLIISLFKVEGLKFGSFTLKSGIQSPVYFDLRVIVSHPTIMKNVSDLVSSEVSTLRNSGEVDLICGVPYTALPIASLVSVEENIPMVLKRKEQKSYGTGKLIEGQFKPGQKCLIIEDVITSGSSIVETTETLRSQGLFVTHAIVILDRGQGAGISLEENGIKFKSLVTMHKMLQVLEEEGLISSKQTQEVSSFLQENQLFDPLLDKALLGDILPKLQCPAAQRLIKIMRKKRSNLCLSADLGKWEEVLEIVDAVGSQICMVKTHIDTVGLKGVKVITEFWTKLKDLAVKHDFLIMEDHKFADIGSTVLKQLESKPFEICKWADLVTMHGISGPGVLNAVEQLNNDLGVVFIAEMSSEGNIPTALPGYKDLIHKMAQLQPQRVAGFVSQSSLPSSSPNYFLQFTPGVSLDSGVAGDGLGQQYNSVENAILKRGADVIIVGRGILKEGKDGWAPAAGMYREKGWNALKKKLLEKA